MICPKCGKEAVKDGHRPFRITNKKTGRKHFVDFQAYRCKNKRCGYQWVDR